MPSRKNLKTFTLVVCLVTSLEQPDRAWGRRAVEDLYLLGLFPVGGDAWPAGEALLLAVNIALEQVNNRTDILPGYRLNLIPSDTMVSVVMCV